MRRSGQFGRTATPPPPRGSLSFSSSRLSKKKNPKSDFKELFDSAPSPTIECLMSRHVAEIFLLHLTPIPIACTIAFRGGKTSMSMNFTRQWSLGVFYFLGLSFEEVFFPPFVIQ